MKKSLFKEWAQRVKATPSNPNILFSNREVAIKVIKKMLTLICKHYPLGAKLTITDSFNGFDNRDDFHLKIDDNGNVTAHYYLINKSVNYPFEELLQCNLEIIFMDIYTEYNSLFQVEFLLILLDELRK